MSEPSADVLALTGSDQAYRWNVAAPVGTPIVVTYSFSPEKPSYDTTARPGFAAYTEAHKVHARAALEVWAQQSAIAFIEVPASVGGQIRFSMYDMSGVLNSVGIQASGFAYYPQSITVNNDGVLRKETFVDGLGGDIYLNANYYAADASTLTPGERGFAIMIHEVGHAIGFKHPFEGTPRIDPNHDNATFTVMSYDRQNSTMLLGSVDIDAARYYYGTEDFTLSWSPTTLTLTQTGTGNADWMHGTELSDSLNGLGGADVLSGWLGNDSYTVAQAGDVVKESLNAGTDTVMASIGYKLPANVENLTLTGTGAINGTGNPLANTLTGNSGNNILDGRAGADILKGFGGNDTLVWSGNADTYYGGGGSDTLKLKSGDLNLSLANILSVERINMTGGGSDVLALNKFDVLDMSPTDTLKVLGDLGDVVHRGAGWSGGGINGSGFRVYTQGLATLLVDQEITSQV